MSETPTSWAEAQLGNLISLEMGQAPAGSACNKEGKGIPFVKAGEFSEARPLVREWTTSPLRFGKVGDVFLCVVGATCGKINYGIDCAIGRSVAALRPSLGLKTEYLYNFLSTKVMLLRSGSTGSAQGVISKPGINSIVIPLPPLPEQKRIVAKLEELFSELEAGEASLRKARRQLGVYRQSLLKQAFEGKLTQTWRTQNADTLGEPLVASAKLDAEPSPLPQGWIWQTLNDVAEITGGLTKNSKRDSLPLRIPYLRVANVYANELRLDEIKDIGVTAAEAKKVRLVKGDLLIVEGNGSLDQIGRVAAWNGSINDCGHQNHLIRARCHPSAYHDFVLMFLLSPHGRDVIEKQAASTSGLHTLSVSKVQRVPVPLCSLPEQQEIVRILDEQFEAIERNERELDAALKRSEALRQSILKRAFSGRLVPQDPADEPASALVARLRAERSATPSTAHFQAQQTLRRLSTSDSRESPAQNGQAGHP